jgi:hypothetical protein
MSRSLPVDGMAGQPTSIMAKGSCNELWDSFQRQQQERLAVATFIF